MTKHDTKFITEAGYAQLGEYLSGARDRAATLGGTWPIPLDAIARPEEFVGDIFGKVPHVKRCGATMDELHEELFTKSEIFSSIITQFRAAAYRLRDYVEQPQLPRDLFWHHGDVKNGPQFIGWHLDGELYTPGPDGPRLVENNESWNILVSGKEFSPAHIYLQAVIELPSIFASRITKAFDANIVRATMDCGRHVYSLQEARLIKWLEANATFTQGPVSRINAFTSGLPHTGDIPFKPIKRTVAVCRLNLKPPFLNRREWS